MSKHILVETKESVCWITICRESKLNSLSGEMYRALCAAFDVANDDDNVVLTVLTGKGSYYSAGSDFSPAEMAAENKLSEGKIDYYAPYKLWADRLIRHQKPVIALINGPALGVSVTTLALCDAVFASDKSTFFCPFTEIGLNPEAGSSLTFVHVMGHIKAAQLALFSEKMTAEEAYVAGLVSKIIPHDSFDKETKEIIKRYSQLGRQSLIVSKRLLRPQSLVEQLLTVNRQEYDVLMGQLVSEEAIKRLAAKFNKAKI